MKNTKFKNKAIKLVAPIVATTTLTSTALVFANSDAPIDYTRGHYIIIGAQQGSSYPRITIHSGSTTYHFYSSGQQMHPFQNYKPSPLQINNTQQNILSIANLLFSGGAGLYIMNLENPMNLAGVFSDIAYPNTFGQLALPIALYIVGTYTPVLKEAVAAADNISKQMAMFTNQTLGSLQNAINTLPNGVRQVVQACLTYDISGGLTGLSQEAVETFLSNSWQSGLNNIVDQCMQGENILAALSSSGIIDQAAVNTYLNQFNPRAWMTSDIQQAGLSPDQNGNLYASDTLVSSTNNLTSLFNPQLVAKDMLIAAMPDFQYSQTVGAIVPQFVYITLPNNSKLLVSTANFKQVTKAIVAEQMYYTTKNMLNATSFSSYYYQYVEPVNNALNLTGQDFYNYWYAIYEAVQTYEYASKYGTLPPPHNYIVVTQKDLEEMHEQLEQAVANLTKLYTAYFRKETLKYLQQDAQENEAKYMAEQETNNRPGYPGSSSSSSSQQQSGGSTQQTIL